MFLSVPKTEAVTVPTECGPPEALIANPGQAWIFQIRCIGLVSFSKCRSV